MARTQRFLNFKNHPWLGRQMKKLRKEEFEFCVDYLEKTSEKTDDQFAHDVNRLGLNGELKEFKNQSLIWSMLSQSIETKIMKRRE